MKQSYNHRFKDHNVTRQVTIIFNCGVNKLRKKRLQWLQAAKNVLSGPQNWWVVPIVSLHICTQKKSVFNIHWKRYKRHLITKVDNAGGTRFTYVSDEGKIISKYQPYSSCVAYVMKQSDQQTGLCKWKDLHTATTSSWWASMHGGDSCSCAKSA